MSFLAITHQAKNTPTITVAIPFLPRHLAVQLQNPTPTTVKVMVVLALMVGAIVAGAGATDPTSSKGVFMKPILTFGILFNTLAIFALAGCTPTSQAITDRPVQATTLRLSHTPYTTEQGFQRNAFCANGKLNKGQSVDIDVRLPQENPNSTTYERYDLLIFPAFKVSLTNPKGESLTMQKFANRYPTLNPAKDLVSPKHYDADDVWSRDLQYAHHEGIYRLSAQENQAFTVCVRNNGFGTKLSDKHYPTTGLADMGVASP